MSNHPVESNPSYRFPENNAAEYRGTVRFVAMYDPNMDTVGNKILEATQALNVTDAGGNRVVMTQSEAQKWSSYLGTEQPGAGSNVPLIQKGSVSLYLPTNLQFADGVEYGSVDLGVRGQITQQGVQSGANAQQLLKNMTVDVMDQVGSLSEAFTKGLGSAAAQLAAVRLAGRFDEGVKGGIELATGVTLNPNKRSILKGVAIRNFSFQFKMIPTSQSEAIAIKNIIRFFRQNMYPEDIITGGVSYGYRFPYKWNISLYYKEQEVATKILTSWLTSVDTNYNPNSQGFHSDGSFPEIDMTLRFVEERALRKQDIEQNY